MNFGDKIFRLKKAKEENFSSEGTRTKTGNAQSVKPSSGGGQQQYFKLMTKMKQVKKFITNLKEKSFFRLFDNLTGLQLKMINDVTCYM